MIVKHRTVIRLRVQGRGRLGDSVLQREMQVCDKRGGAVSGHKGPVVVAPANWLLAQAVLE